MICAGDPHTSVQAHNNECSTYLPTIYLLIMTNASFGQQQKSITLTSNIILPHIESILLQDWTNLNFTSPRRKKLWFIVFYIKETNAAFRVQSNGVHSTDVIRMWTRKPLIWTPTAWLPIDVWATCMLGSEVKKCEHLYVLGRGPM